MLNEYTSCKICKGSIKLQNKTFNLVECTSCKLVFCKKQYTQEQFIEVYDNLYNNTAQYNVHIAEFEKLKNNSNVKLGRVKRKVLQYILGRKPTLVAEIGAGVGVAAKHCLDQGVNYKGLELDRETVNRAQSIGLPIFCGDFKQLSDFDTSIDALVAFEVIEHLQDLNELFKILKRKLTPDGYFGFTVPNYSKRLNFENVNDRIFQSGPPIHLNFFTIKNIENIASYYNFEVIFCKEKKYPFFLWRNFDTYVNMIKGFFGHFRGPSLYVVLRNNE